MIGVFFSKLRGILLSLLFIVGGTAAAILLGVVLFSGLSSISLHAGRVAGCHLFKGLERKRHCAHRRKNKRIR